eukprot:scaffold199024_cov14-Tisochrysis_lutea.AAC.1
MSLLAWHGNNTKSCQTNKSARMATSAYISSSSRQTTRFAPPQDSYVSSTDQMYFSTALSRLHCMESPEQDSLVVLQHNHSREQPEQHSPDVLQHCLVQAPLHEVAKAVPADAQQ